jgi:two-component system chemotaxis sensor kinase CheA
MPQSAELRRQIEDLALRLVIAEPEPGTSASEWIPALERVRESARRDRADDVVRVAGAFMDAIRQAEDAGAADADRLGAELQDGIARLQQAIEADGRREPTNYLMPAQDPELLGDFVLESREHLTGIEAQALTIERDPFNAEALNSVFRGFHTIKGLAGFLELWDVQELAHEVEAILDRARNSELTITPDAIDIILQGADYLRRCLSHLELQMQRQPSEPPGKDQALLARIRALSGPVAPGQSADGIAALGQALEIQPEQAALPATALLPSEPILAMGDLKEPAALPTPPAEQTPRNESRAVSIDTEQLTAPFTHASVPTARNESRTAGIGAEDAAAPATPSAVAPPRSESRAVKVDTAKLDYLVDMAGEMVIAESLVRHDPELAGVRSPGLQRKIAQLTRITAELQKTAMSMRLVPIGPLFQRMARLVRDLSRQFGKRVTLETVGDDIELDRTIVEELSDPLMHMVRNALDHGIESPEERQSHGKDPTARLLLKAHHQAGQVVIEIADDGQGLDRDKIKAKAIEKGLIASTEGMTDSEIHNLVFLPGFSTAARVTNISGRGVGMDVVRRHIEKLRGRIEIRSSPGCGSAFLLKLPLTLAIIDGLVVGVGQERYIVPLFAIREMFRPAQETIWTVQQRSEMALVRGALLPVHRLYRRFGVTPRSEDPLQSVLVVAEVEGQRFCLMVDELIGKQEVVIKTLGETFQNVAGIAGGAILGDGRVGLILDLDRLFKDKTGDSSY